MKLAILSDLHFGDPACALVTLVRARLASVAPGMALPLKPHWNWSGAVPVAATAKEAFSPRRTAWWDGCDTMAGGSPPW